MTTTNEILERRLGLALDFQGSLAAELNCPKCKVPHLDTDEWATKPHRTHMCLECGHEWRPCNFPTVGVASKENK